MGPRLINSPLMRRASSREPPPLLRKSKITPEILSCFKWRRAGAHIVGAVAGSFIRKTFVKVSVKSGDLHIAKFLGGSLLLNDRVFDVGLFNHHHISNDGNDFGCAVSMLDRQPNLRALFAANELHCFLLPACPRCPPVPLGPGQPLK